MDALKRCPACDRELPLDGFHRNRRTSDGLQSRCKPCHMASVRRSRLRHPETYREYMRRRLQGPAGDNDRQLKAEWKRNNPEKVAAQTAVSNAIRLGHLVRPDECEQCGSDRFAIQGHHEDYAAQLDVTWLCAPCHGLLHHGAVA